MKIINNNLYDSQQKMIRKINPDTTNVFIGSGTAEEYKFQILNFMYMLYYNIHYSDGKNSFSAGICMTVSAVVSNLKIFIKQAVIMTDINKGKTAHIYNLINTIFNKLYNVEDYLKSSYLKKLKKECDEIWKNPLEELTGVFDLKYEINN